MRHAVKRSNSEGISLIEMTIMSAIVLVFAVIVIGGYPRFNKGVYVKKEAQRFAFDLRAAQNFAILGKVAEQAGYTPRHWGLHVDISTPDRYIIFADLNDNEIYDSGVDEISSTNIFENGVRITNIFYSFTGFPNPAVLDFTFGVPYGETQIVDGSAGHTGGSYAVITLTPAGDASFTNVISKDVNIRRSGQISISN